MPLVEKALIGYAWRCFLPASPIGASALIHSIRYLRLYQAIQAVLDAASCFARATKAAFAERGTAQSTQS